LVGWSGFGLKNDKNIKNTVNNSKKQSTPINIQQGPNQHSALTQSTFSKKPINNQSTSNFSLWGS
jgi:hypothetical protein